MTLRDEIKKLIADLGITRHRAAVLAGLAPQNVYTFLRTGRGLSVASVEKLRGTLKEQDTTPPSRSDA